MSSLRRTRLLALAMRYPSNVWRPRLLSSMRLLLDNPDFADQVILDLSRWEDWSVLDRVVDMFKKSDAKGFVRQPVVSYLTVASEQPGPQRHSNLTMGLRDRQDQALCLAVPGLSIEVLPY